MLSVQNLEYYYGRIHALRGVSFEIKEGDLCVIIGSNGAGKSTLMSSLIGMLDATGDIYLNGEKLGRESRMRESTGEWFLYQKEEEYSQTLP